ncbi:hypothetical protein TU56_26275 [Bacillus cereus]|uniref:hypothetical protein n=1 Tax=Bacillus cereus TaxID=1396 RepID=UPI00065B50C4|nr:hypothetical protein [Bacillus cereus]KMP42355.1 hypothetical protein TU56_26275 [Bacillus cereus]MEB9886080.1 hypothetical protein [Bacillus cereus]
MFKKKPVDPLEVLINKKGDFRNAIPTEIGIYALERIKTNQSGVKTRVNIAGLGRNLFIDTKEIEINKGEKDEWLIKFGEYDLNIYKKGFNNTPIYLEWANETTFRLQFRSRISDTSNVHVTFYGDIGQLTKQQYFADMKIRIKFIKYTSESEYQTPTVTPELLIDRLKFAISKERHYEVFEPEVISVGTVSNHEIIATLSITGKERDDSQLREFLVWRIEETWNMNSEIIVEII